MPTHEIKCTTGCVYLCRVVEAYEPWQAIGQAFSRYDVDQLATFLFRIYYTGTDTLKAYTREDTIEDLTGTFERLLLTIEALYFMARDKGIDVNVPPPEAGFRQEWIHEKVKPMLVVNYFCDCNEPHEARNNLWMLFEGTFGAEWSGLSKRERRKLTTQFENLTDLTTAAYAIARAHRLIAIK
ncbi:hypothetical protein [Paraflavitalea pollutisoli]|uniref:hypothetical protein n=1 Tax=Paraflavitalea pollutisoli TaxID=3034143 RepID=UPI0023EE1A60|nr:hypothetical protein [Paraflavitalea sp. H1-2-19X]